MDTPVPIDLDSWPRRRHFEHYRHAVPCTYSMTVEVDVTELDRVVRVAGRRAYLTQVWAVAAVVNRHEEFRLTVDDAGAPAVWPQVHPAFTVLNAERETFASVWVPFSDDFATFHDAAVEVVTAHASATDLFPQGQPPPNTFDVSSLPWTSFTGFNLNVDGGASHLAPIFTIGRYVERDRRLLMPLAVQVNHAAADGFHTARLVNELRELLSDGSWIAG